MPATELARKAVFKWPLLSFGSIGFALSAAALGPVPAFPPLIVLLSVLRLAAQAVIPRKNGVWRFVFVMLAASLGASVRHVGPAVHALSSLAQSIFSLLLLSTASSVVAFAALFADQHITGRVSGSYARALVFPALWASLWAVASTSPFGRLFAWSPALTDVGEYSWLAPYVGTWGVDWVVASWAVVFSDIAGALLMDTWSNEDLGTDDTAPLIDVADYESHGQQTQPLAASRTRKLPSPTWVLAALLILLASPAAFSERALPLPSQSDDILSIRVACVLPGPLTGGNPPGFDAFLDETVRMNDAKIVLWPEGAVRFESMDDRDEKVKLIHDKVFKNNANQLVGVSFVDNVLVKGSGERYQQRNGFVLLSKDGIVHEYQKRNLVPIAESYGMQPGVEPAKLTTIHYPLKKGRTWRTEPLNISAAICMDFASSAPFSDLTARPALILAPARTWDIRAGTAMWAHARARAAELGAGALLWCDGGEGGISGIAGTSAGASGRIMRVGQGSWETEVPLPQPFEDERTPYARYQGGWSIFALVWAIVGLGAAVDRVHIDIQGSAAALRVRGAAQALIEGVKQRGRRLTTRRQAPDEAPLLGD